jgi:glycosyltransferase involved in cell wall biosynthesis
MDGLMDAPRFSVVIPTFGRPEYLGEAIASVLAQTVGDFECIIVDDAGPTPVDVPTDPRVRVVRRSTNGGPAAARNTGIDEARGEYVTFLDDDDLYEPNRLDLALAGHERAPVVICGVSFSDHADGSGERRQLEGDVTETILDGLTPALGATSVARDVIVRFDERLDNVEDVDWWRRQATVSRVTTVNAVGLRYRRHDGPRHRTNLARRVDANVKYLEREQPWFDEHPRAAAFRWKRVGLLAASLGDRRTARAAFARSLRLQPEPATVWHLARSVVVR